MHPVSPNGATPRLEDFIVSLEPNLIEDDGGSMFGPETSREKTAHMTPGAGHPAQRHDEALHF